MSDTTAAADPVKNKFLRLVETRAEAWEPSKNPVVISPEGPDEDDNLPDKPGRGGPRLLALLNECPLMVDPAGQTYISIEGELYALDSKNGLLVETASELYCRATGGAQTLGKDGLTAAVAVLSRRARTTGDKVLMANRTAFYGEALYIDLGNDRAVRIAGGTWEVVRPPLGLFRGWSHKQPQPEPVKPGNAWKIFEFVNVRKEDRELFLYTLPALFVPGVARPALAINGPQGSGKSQTGKRFKQIIDPTTPLLTLMPRKPEDLDLILERNHCLVFDNLSGISPDVSDTLAGVITGATPQRRKLHTDSDLMTLHADVALIFTSITALSSRPDFMERTLRIQLDRIEDTARLADDELDAAFNAAVPEILGGLLTLLAEGLNLL